MKMYIANCTPQGHDFLYRLPEVNKITRMRIEAGGQVALPGDLNTKEIEAVVRHHARYGMIEAGARQPGFAGLCYSVDKPVPHATWHATVAKNLEVLSERGKEMRMQTAIGIEEAIEKNAPGAINALELEVVEERRDGKIVDAPAINEGVRVDRGFTGKGPVAENPGLARQRAGRRGR